MSYPKLLLLTLVNFIFSCRKSKEEPVPEPEPAPTPDAIVPDTVRAFHKLDPSIRPYYNFTDDSYWIYADSIHNQLDSMTIKEYSFHIDTVISKTLTRITIDIYETITYNLSGKYYEKLIFQVRGSKVLVSTTTYNLKFYSSNAFVYDTIKRNCTSTDLDGSRNFCSKFYSNLQLPNGKTYLNVKLSMNAIFCNGSYCGGHLPIPTIHTKSIWSEGTGLVRYETLRPDHPVERGDRQLLRYSVKMRP